MTQHHKNKQPTQKIGRSPEQTFFQGHTDGQQAYEKIFNIVIREMQLKTTMRLSFHTSQNGMIFFILLFFKIHFSFGPRFIKLQWKC